MLTRVLNVLYQVKCRSFAGKKIVKSLIRLIKDIQVLALIAKRHDKKYVVVGTNKKSIFYSRCTHAFGKLWGVCCISTIPDKNVKYYRECEDLYDEKINDLYFLLFEELDINKTKGKLFKLGVEDSQMIIMKHKANAGKVFETFDVNLGLCWNSGDNGFVEYTCEDKDALKIVILGSSTSDPYSSGTIKGWPEYLWEKLNKTGISCRVFNGSVASYTVTQEWIKLYRDVVEMHPDLVISFSGINDLLQDYYVNKHYFSLKYIVDIFENALKKKMIKNVVQVNNVIHDYTLGIEQSGDKPKHWIKCQRMMHSVCNEFNIEFLGVLQAYNEDDANVTHVMKEQYSETKKLIVESNYSWLLDFTNIFDGHTNIFWDRCHVYEKGNEIISEKIMGQIKNIIEK